MEQWFSYWKLLPLLQRTLVQFPTPTWWLTTFYSSSSRDICCPLLVSICNEWSDRQDIHASKTPKHIHFFKKKLSNSSLKILTIIPLLDTVKSGTWSAYFLISLSQGSTSALQLTCNTSPFKYIFRFLYRVSLSCPGWF